MKVLGSKLLVKVEKSGGVTQKIGNLTIPASNKDYETATVLDVGKELEEESVKAGDKVYIYFGSGKSFFHEGEEFRAITVNDIIVVL